MLLRTAYAKETIPSRLKITCASKADGLTPVLGAAASPEEPALALAVVATHTTPSNW